MYPLRVQMQWPSLAQDLALLNVPNSPFKGGLDEVRDAYGLTPEEFRATLAIPQFQLMFQKAMDDVSRDGSRAGVRARAAMLSQALAEKLFRDATASGMEHKEAIKLLDSLLKMSGLDKEQKGEVQVNTQVNVHVPVPAGVAKVAHCIPVETVRE